MKFKLMDKVILKNGQKGIIFELPEITHDPTTTIRDITYGVLYVDSKNFHYGPYYINEDDIALLVDTTIGVPAGFPVIDSSGKIVGVTNGDCSISITDADFIKELAEHKVEQINLSYKEEKK